MFKFLALMFKIEEAKLVLEQYDRTTGNLATD